MTDLASQNPRPSSDRTVVLCILDGWGLREEPDHNAVALARTPHYDALLSACAHTSLSASGRDVGLPDEQFGNSEVGHTNIGAGRVVLMDLPKIDADVESGAFARRSELAEFISVAGSGTGVAHVIGLGSTGGVHAHRRHLIASLKAFDAAGLSSRVHLLLDGRDTAPKTAMADLAALEAEIAPLADAKIATVTGRYFALDRDNRWDRVVAAYRAVADGQGAAPRTRTAADAVAAAYARGETDEFVQATVVGAYAGIADGDSLFMTHFRADRAREILSALLVPGFSAFDRGPGKLFCGAAGMVSYSETLDTFITAIYPPEQLTNTLGEWVAKAGVAQFRVAETEKYPHVTFFLNGGVEAPHEGEARHMPPSPKVATYDLAPQMAAADVTDALTKAILSKAYGLIVANYANPDMVGHTGDLSAAIAAVEAVDAGLGAVVEAVRAAGGAMLVVADHGNCEVMRDPETGEPHTAHTTNPVPAILLDARPDAPVVAALRGGGRLADVAPTVLDLMGLQTPSEMTGRSLLG